MSSKEIMLVKIPVFIGDKKNFLSWWIKIEAYASVKVFHSVLKDSEIAISDADVKTLELKSKYGSGGKDYRTSDEELQLKLGKKNW